MTHNQLRWEETLWTAGHRVTRQRALILEAICAGDGHTPLGAVYARVRKTDRTIDRSTIYRAVRLFVELGIVVAADTGDGETYYEVAHPAPHHHLVCRNCGGEWEIGDDAMQAMFAEIAKRHDFRVDTDHLVLFGQCATCWT
jgi:Fur family transcriptional regulator, ferric uptake regulator